jgi:type I restriction enzyme S subunit
MRNIELPLPSLQTQNRIAAILSAYDDLIENNRRRIQLLEQAARLLYKEWFVHLRYPGHDHAAQQPTGATELHPEGTSANDSANPRANIKTLPGNSLPEGWERKKIDDVCETVGGGTPSTKTPEYWDGDITWVVPSDITKNDSLALLGSERKITEKGLRESSAKMVPAETILMTSRASVGFFAIMDYEICTNQGFINIIPHDKNLRMYLLFNLMNRVEEIRGNAKGSTYPEISKGRFRDMDIIVPPEALISEFSEIAHNIIRQARILKKSTMKLEKARDLLLPRLMDGQVEV